MPLLDGHHIEGLLFDADGTLIDTYDIILDSMRHTVNNVYGAHASESELMAGVGTPLYDQMLTFAKGDEAKATQMVDEYRRHNDAIHDDGIQAFPGARKALERLRDAGFPLGVVTSKRHALAALGLELAGIADFFAFVIGSDDWPEHKPHPGPILRGCEMLNLSPEQCAYIGDSPFDIQAANAAGCLSIAALWGMFTPAALRAQHPDRECASLCALADMIIGSA